MSLHNRIYIYPVLVLYFLFIEAGCASSVDTKPFVKFNNAVQEAQTGIDDAMSVNYRWTKMGFIESFSADTNSSFSQLIILPGEKYDWSMPEPAKHIYLDIKVTQLVLSDLNNAFKEYASLLQKLAGKELVSTATFDQLAKGLNQSATDAVKALRLSVPGNMELFSKAAAEVARLYIEKKRQKYLLEAIEKNQENVQSYSDLCIGLIHTIRGTMRAYYVERYEPIKNEWNITTGKKRQKLTEVMLNLNDQFTSGLRVLKGLEVAYANLPKAHAELVSAVK